ncbi:MAG: primosomal protein N' [Acutalibacteraceae bacterium]
MSYTVAQVAVENTAYSFDTLYSYAVPAELVSLIKAGCRVIVPFGFGKNNKRQGVVFSLSHEDDVSRLKKVKAVLDKAPLLNNEALLIARRLHDKTFCTYYDAAKVQLPTGIDLKIRTRYVSIGSMKEKSSELSDKEKQIYDFLEERQEYADRDELISVFGLDRKAKILDEMAEKGFILRNYDTVKRIGDATARMVRLALDKEEIENSFKNLTPKQRSVIELLYDIGAASVKEVCYFTGVTEAVIKNLVAKGIAEIFSVETFRKPKVRLDIKKPEKVISLTDEQQTAFEHLKEKYKSGGCSLLYGVTGSGKTSVYIKLIDEVLPDGKGIIVMVPEISLTPALFSTFRQRYGDKVAVFHSGLSVGERYDEWKRVKSGDAQIVVGTRSAVFAPFDSVGLIIMDEEQEHTYKSEQSPRFHARDVAKFRAAYNHALLVLASATPSVESYSLAVKGRYSLEKLNKRYGNAVLPKVTVVDMRKELKTGNKYSISSFLLEELEENLNEGNQSILLINRRGYNTFASCDECGKVRVCPSCSVSLSYHSDNGRLMCHYCGYSEIMDNRCPECGKKAVRFSGRGTQKIEDELKELLPKARVVRMDTDSTLYRYAHEDKLNAFSNGEYDILLGTQMVAKGLDFEKVTLVGVLSADDELNGGDYMSSERAFDLLTQVIGRAGRGDARGKAVIQTLTPESSVIHMAQKQDYEAFYENEIYIRKMMVYPPYCDICSIVFACEDEMKALAAARGFIYGIKKGIEEKYSEQKLIVLGPMPPKIFKLGGKYRYRIIIKCHNNNYFRSMISDLLILFSRNKENKNVSVTIDINPESLA